ncbi:hypothetical protein GM661_00510 [Iocasia frigidifontis]|uniref:Uncharacterized protein n=1 Tax=Iocasia fonsfrigidae TaxID=2682810 RepID=A0A8A7K8W4_9FIRM|nr:hypothetical protein [Iocasia fonsfrigidae]QTL96555.1 hypothetical protein GM661_00510 [Iocasia fonsfrigidae]
MGATTFYLLEQERKKKAVSRKGGQEARAEVEKKTIDVEEEAETEEEKSITAALGLYHTGGGWYQLPGQDKAVRKDEAIKILKESDS